MIQCKPFEISKEVYIRAKQNRGYITNEDKNRLFTPQQLCGYGVYSAIAYKENEKYYCSYYLGSSCD